MRPEQWWIFVLSIGFTATAAVRAQEICAGFIGASCGDPYEYCRLADGECCCDFQGVCTAIPDTCAAVDQPVCGCDGVTYVNRCRAAKAGASVAHACACDTPPSPPTSPVTHFSAGQHLHWTPVDSALGYNIYRAGLVSELPHFSCVHTDHPPNPTFMALTGQPPIGEAWAYLVTPLTVDGEGSFGAGSSCDPRQNTDRCACTLEPEIGDCDGKCPRWYYDPLSDQCEPFMWGCCGGNPNNFATIQECALACP